MSISPSDNNHNLLDPNDVFPRRGTPRAVSFCGNRQLKWNANPQKYVKMVVKAAGRRSDSEVNSLSCLIQSVKNCLSDAEFRSNGKEMIESHFTIKKELDKSVGLFSINPLDEPYDFIRSNPTHFNGSSVNLETINQSLEELEHKVKIHEAVANIYREIIKHPHFKESPFACIDTWMHTTQAKNILTKPEQTVFDFFKNQLETSIYFQKSKELTII